MVSFCLQVKQPQKAANAAYTHLIYNPDDEVMRDNMHYYLSENAIDRDKLVNLEQEVRERALESGVNSGVSVIIGIISNK